MTKKKKKNNDKFLPFPQFLKYPKFLLANKNCLSNIIIVLFDYSLNYFTTASSS